MNKPHSNNHHSNDYYQDDEIDLRDLFIALWKGKVIIILTTFVFAVVAVVYALNAQEWWSSKAKVVEPQINDFSVYREQVKSFQPIFDTYQDDGTVLVSKELDSLVEPEMIFAQFVRAFNATANKKAFFDNNETFLEFKKVLKQEEQGADAAVAQRRLYDGWYQKISATPAEKNRKDVYNLSLQATTQMDSYNLLNDYIKMIERQVHEDAIDNLKAALRAKKTQLQQQKVILETQARQRLAVELQRAKYAYDIASAASVNTPVQNLGDKELFSINLGAKAIQAKISALESVKKLDVIEPRLLQIEAKLDLMKTIELDEDIEFKSYRFIEDVEQPLNRDEPKRSLIAVLGALFGGMLGVGIVLIRFAFNRKETTEE
ncbi:regulator of length of O-antigen component of lipopolysaccharide chains [Vibrio ishigakensis]|uniref:Regulator of length of O-antigen component of lipopolysaccharide chains n=1 Tax=Vibrio ishigakensis TaxID=1481914 RepID=A0A0B8QF69_9VIBR|nr:regulator of length of O-antigen component of lipopolysaccharide chains [Vibrio ishigakensis]